MRVSWFNGALVEDTIALDPQDRGLLLGDGVFETIAVLEGKPQWLSRHLVRMESAAQELGIGFDRTMIAEGVAQVLRTRDALPKILRISLSRGRAPGGLGADGEAPSALITADRLDSALIHQPVALKVSAITRNAAAPSSRLKTLSYVDQVMAARGAGADEALMLNTAGRIACSPIANIFLLKGRELLTPALGEGILPGIMRARVLEVAGQLGYDTQERKLELGDLMSADAAFLTNSLRLARPVTHVDGQALGDQGLGLFINALKPHLLEGASP